MTSFVVLRMQSGGNSTIEWRTKNWVVLQNNAPAHRLVLVKDFFSKNNVTKLEHPTRVLATSTEIDVEGTALL